MQYGNTLCNTCSKFNINNSKDNRRVNMKASLYDKILTVVAGLLLLVALGLMTGCDTLNSQQYRFTSDVHQNSIDKILNKLDTAEEIIGFEEKFTLIITSAGGQVNAYKSLLHRMNSSELYIVTKVHTYAASAGAMMFLMGDERILVEGAELLFHYGRYIINGEHLTVTVMKNYLKNPALVSKGERAILDSIGKKDVKKYMKMLDETNKEIFNIVANALTEETAKKLLKDGEDVTLNAEEALKYGVATKVIKFRSQK